jgi:hypothetical protein
MATRTGTRVALRTAIAATLAGLSALTTALADSAISAVEVTLIATAIVGSIAAYLGIGAATISEPFFGREKVVEVPADSVVVTDG